MSAPKDNNKRAKIVKEKKLAKDTSPEAIFKSKIDVELYTKSRFEKLTRSVKTGRKFRSQLKELSVMLDREEDDPEYKDVFEQLDIIEDFLSTIYEENLLYISETFYEDDISLLITDLLHNDINENEELKKE